MRRLRLARSCASSPDNYPSDKLSLVLLNHIRFGLHLLPFPGTPIPITLLPTYSSSLLNTCAYHVYLLSCTFLDIPTTFVVPLILSILILSSLVTPLIHLNIRVSATSNAFYCDIFTVPRLNTIYHCWYYNCIVYFPLHSPTYSSVAHNPRY